MVTVKDVYAIGSIPRWEEESAPHESGSRRSQAERPSGIAPVEASPSEFVVGIEVDVRGRSDTKDEDEEVEDDKEDHLAGAAIRRTNRRFLSV